MMKRFSGPLSACLFLVGMGILMPCTIQAGDYERKIQPLLKQYCLGCHSTAKHKGDLDLEKFASLGDVLKHPAPWQKVVEQLSLGEMPPKEKPQPTPGERAQLIAWVNSTLETAAKANAGDPGPVVLRRLSNAEYNYTLRDLTGVESLEPAREFPADSASGEGFMNVGNSLVMSPSLLTKYLDAAKEVANHAMLLPDGISFSASTSQRDWSEEKLAAIRAFYGRFTENGGGTAVNLQGIKFDTKDGGVLPLEKYLAATISERSVLKSGKKTVAQVAVDHGLNQKYLGLLWSALNATNTSPVLDPIRAQWRTAKPGDAGVLVQSISLWQQALWRFTTVGHIGKRDGPKAWQVPVSPLASSREVRMVISPTNSNREVMLYLSTTDAGDGNTNDFAVWENPRLVAAGRPDISLRDVSTVFATLTAQREKIFTSAARCLAAMAEFGDSLDEKSLVKLAEKHKVQFEMLRAWMNYLGIGVGNAPIESHLTNKLEKAESYDFVKGWTGPDAMSVLANSSDQEVRIPGKMKPHGVAVHPSPTRRVIVGWRSPVATSLRVDGLVQHAHVECGNGVTWALELRRGNSRQRLATGVAHGAKGVKFGPLENVDVRAGDVLSLVIGPRDGDYSCDLTALDLNLTDGTRTWNFAKEISPNILAGNPHADSLGHADVWHFFSEPDQGGGAELMLPVGSLLANWQSSTNAAEKQRLAGEIQNLLLHGANGLATNAPDTVLFRQLNSLNGPLLSSILRSSGRESAQTPPAENQSRLTSAATNWGIDPALFGKHPNGTKLGATSLCVRAPSSH